MADGRLWHFPYFIHTAHNLKTLIGSWLNGYDCSRSFFTSQWLWNIRLYLGISFSVGHYVKLFIEHSKTDVYRDGKWFYISCSDTKYCPVKNLEYYLETGEIPDISEEYIFRAIQYCIPSRDDRPYGIRRNHFRTPVPGKSYWIVYIRLVWTNVSSVYTVCDAEVLRPPPIPGYRIDCLSGMVAGCPKQWKMGMYKMIYVNCCRFLRP